MEIYAIKIKDNNIRKSSSSGGAFSALSNVILNKAGFVIGSKYEYGTDEMQFAICDSKDKRDILRGSKYIQCNPNNSFIEIYELIKSNMEKPILIVGVGCQIHALKSFLEVKKVIISNVYFADLICHGVSSPMVWKEYIDYLKNRYKGELKYLTFKDKSKGWLRPTSYAIIGNNKISLFPYFKTYSEGRIIRPSCYHCPYCSIDRNSDITIGDYWGIEKVEPNFYDESGVSLVIVHTEKGKELMDQIREEVDYHEETKEKCLQPNLIHPTDFPSDRDLFWKQLKKHGVGKTIGVFDENSIIKRIKRKVKRIVFRHKL